MTYSRTFNPSAAMCCSACVFGKGEHAHWCEKKPDKWADYRRVAAPFKQGDLLTITDTYLDAPSEWLNSENVAGCSLHPQSACSFDNGKWCCAVCGADQHAAEVFRERFKNA